VGRELFRGQREEFNGSYSMAQRGRAEEILVKRGKKKPSSEGKR